MRRFCKDDTAANESFSTSSGTALVTRFRRNNFSKVSRLPFRAATLNQLRKLFPVGLAVLALELDMVKLQTWLEAFT